MVMPLHHYLPAGYMGAFSQSDDGPRRSRPVWCLRRGSERPFPTKPENLGAVNDFYTLKQSWEPQSLDQVWTYFERTLPSAINALVDSSRPLDANVWLRTLVPFVASLFVRGREFNARYENRRPELQNGLSARGLLNADNTNAARLMELQRLLAQVAAAHWGVVRTTNPKANFITNEIGISAARVSGFESTHGWLVPLDRHHILTVTPRRTGAVMTREGLGWKAIIGRLNAQAGEVRQINYTTACMAREFVVAGEQGPLKALRGKWRQPPERDWLSGGWGCSSEERVAHEFDWHRLVSVASNPYQARPDLQHIDNEIWAQEWCPPPMFPDNLPEFRTGLHLNGRTITLELGARNGFPGPPRPGAIPMLLGD